MTRRRPILLLICLVSLSANAEEMTKKSFMKYFKEAHQAWKDYPGNRDWRCTLGVGADEEGRLEIGSLPVKKAGLRNGDLLISLNSKARSPIPGNDSDFSFTDFIRDIPFSKGDVIDFVVERDGERLSFTPTCLINREDYQSVLVELYSDLSKGKVEKCFDGLERLRATGYERVYHTHDTKERCARRMLLTRRTAKNMSQSKYDLINFEFAMAALEFNSFTEESLDEIKRPLERTIKMFEQQGSFTLADALANALKAAEKKFQQPVSGSRNRDSQVTSTSSNGTASSIFDRCKKIIDDKDRLTCFELATDLVASLPASTSSPEDPAEELLDAFIQISSRVEVGISYQNYGPEVGRLRIAQSRYTRAVKGDDSDRVTEIIKLADRSFGHFNDALDLWGSKFDGHSVTIGEGSSETLFSRQLVNRLRNKYPRIPGKSGSIKIDQGVRHILEAAAYRLDLLERAINKDAE